MANANFEGANLTGIEMQGANFDGVHFSDEADLAQTG